MARIADSRGRSDENSGYTRLFGVPRLGQLMSRVQAAVIRTGNELEKLLEDATPEHLRALRSGHLRRRTLNDRAADG
jgi:hypothetical protein